MGVVSSLEAAPHVSPTPESEFAEKTELQALVVCLWCECLFCKGRESMKITCQIRYGGGGHASHDSHMTDTHLSLSADTPLSHGLLHIPHAPRFHPQAWGACRGVYLQGGEWVVTGGGGRL